MIRLPRETARHYRNPSPAPSLRTCATENAPRRRVSEAALEAHAADVMRRQQALPMAETSFRLTAQTSPAAELRAERARLAAEAAAARRQLTLPGAENPRRRRRQNADHIDNLLSLAKQLQQVRLPIGLVIPVRARGKPRTQYGILWGDVVGTIRPVTLHDSRAEALRTLRGTFKGQPGRSQVFGAATIGRRALKVRL